MKTKLFATAMTLSLLALQAQANFTYEGSLVDNAGNPVSGTVLFTLEIVNPTDTCVLYKESHNVAMTNPDGYFSLTVGAGTVMAAPNNLPNSFQNGTVLNCFPSGTYTGSANDNRNLKVSITVNGGTAESLGTVAINSVPTAYAAKVASTANTANTANSVGLFQPQHLMRAVDGGGNPAPISAFDPGQVSELMNLMAGTSTRYQTKSPNGATNVPTYSGMPAAPVPGNMWYDSTTNVLKYYNGMTEVPLNAPPPDMVTVTGLMTLPPDSIRVGSNQFVTMGGRVGIGTSSPMFNLDVIGTSGPDVALFKSLAGGGNTSIAIANNIGDTPVRLGSINNDFVIKTGSGGSPNERVRVNQMGQVGIGIMNPVSQLHVMGAIQIGDDPQTCMGSKAGAIRYNTGISRVEFCDGGMWKALKEDNPGPPEQQTSGTFVDFSMSPTIILTSVSGSSITLNPMMYGTHFKLIIEDPTPRMYTFTGGTCSTFKFSPANTSTAGNTAIYEFYRTIAGTCYVTWKTYQ